MKQRDLAARTFIISWAWDLIKRSKNAIASSSSLRLKVVEPRNTIKIITSTWNWMRFLQKWMKNIAREIWWNFKPT